MLPSVPLYFWTDQKNFGDELSSAVVEWLSGYPVRSQRSGRHPRLFAVGSILEKARNGDVAWGAGIHPVFYDNFWTRANFGWKKRLIYRVRPYDVNVLAVRGPLTRDAILFRGSECPEIFGDPGILLPLMYPKQHNPIRKVGVIPHYSDKHWFQQRGIEFIDVAQSWQHVVDRIMESEVVISTSLHGIIVAEAYGVPAIWLRKPSNEGFMKYADYYLGSNRAPCPVYSYEEALVKKPLLPPDFSEQRKNLMASFDKKIIEGLLS